MKSYTMRRTIMAGRITGIDGLAFTTDGGTLQEGTYNAEKDAKLLDAWERARGTVRLGDYIVKDSEGFMFVPRFVFEAVYDTERS